MKEIDIENQILDYLSKLRGGFVHKIHLSGKPIRKGSKIIKIIPFGSKHYQIGMSDILFIFRGRTYCFEVKTPNEYKKIKKGWDKLKQPKQLLPKSWHHFKDQYEYLERVRKAGGVGEFVCSLDQVIGFL